MKWAEIEIGCVGVSMLLAGFGGCSAGHLLAHEIPDNAEEHSARSVRLAARGLLALDRGVPAQEPGETGGSVWTSDVGVVRAEARHRGDLAGDGYGVY